MRVDDVKLQTVKEAATRMCWATRFDPVLDWLASLKWDGIPWLDKWLATYVGADDTKLNRAFARKYLCAMVKRAKQPGCKFDYVLVFHGEQGQKKSFTAEILAGGADYFTERPILHADPKVQQEVMKGRWIVEFGDLAGMSRAEIESVKNFITTKVERNRGAYKHFVEDQPRRCVFFATTNKQDFHKDETGGRRFWLVNVQHKVDEIGLRRDRDQLFAEAVVAEAAGKLIYLPRDLEVEAAALINTCRPYDPRRDTLVGVKGLIYGGEERIPSTELYKSLSLSTDKQTIASCSRIKTVMNDLGWEGQNLYARRAALKKTRVRTRLRRTKQQSSFVVFRARSDGYSRASGVTLPRGGVLQP